LLVPNALPEGHLVPPESGRAVDALRMFLSANRYSPGSNRWQVLAETC
jgi:hypothetical protein